LIAAASSLACPLGVHVSALHVNPVRLIGAAIERFARDIHRPGFAESQDGDFAALRVLEAQRDFQRVEVFCFKAGLQGGCANPP
jgi:hypothetical protein